MDSRMCSAQKCAFWQRGAEPTTYKGPERLLRTSAVRLRAGRPHNLPQVRFLSLQVFVTYCMNATTKPVLARTSTSVPRTRSSFSAFAFTVTHIVKVTGKGATTTLPIPSPMPVTHMHALGDEIAEASFGRRAEPSNTRIKNRYRYTVAVAANLEP